MKLKVMNPMGYPPAIEQVEMAPRYGSLGKRPVYLVDCRVDDGYLLMEQMKAWFDTHMPEVNTKLRRKDGVISDRDEALYKEIRDSGGAAVVAVGH